MRLQWCLDSKKSNWKNKKNMYLPLNKRCTHTERHKIANRPYAYDVIISFRPHYAVKAQTSLAPLSCLAGSRGLMRMRTNIVYFRATRRLYRREWNWTMILTMREPASMTTDTWSRRVTSDSNSVLGDIGLRINTVVSDVPAADHKRMHTRQWLPPTWRRDDVNA